MNKKVNKALEKKIDEVLERGISDLIGKEELRKKLMKDPTKVIIKYGMDPTSSDIHLGHVVCLRKLRAFQDLGCKVVFLIGDVTAQIGDPTGKSKIRPVIQLQEIEKNMMTYLEQGGKILLQDKNHFIWTKNSDWFVGMHDIQAPGKTVKIKHIAENTTMMVPSNDVLAKAFVWRDTRMEFQRNKSKKDRVELRNISLINFLAVLQKITHAHLIGRDMFQERIKKGEPLFMHEMLYPVIQGLDSVEIATIFGSCDLELGGTDQHFNMLLGRDVMQIAKQPPQSVMSMPLLEGLDGIEKMSKSLGNYIGVSDDPIEMFGKIMSIGDPLMMRYFELCTDENLDEMKKLVKKDPRNAKVHLAKTIITFYHNESEADRAEQDFITKFVKKDIPDDVPEFSVSESEIGILTLISQVCGFASSNSEARRLIQGDGVSIDGKKINDSNIVIKIKGNMVLKVGKRKFGRIIKK